MGRLTGSSVQRAVVGVGIALQVACTPTSDVAAQRVHGTPLCKADVLQDWIGKPRETVPQREEDVFRFLFPWDKRSMDYRPERTNIFLDSNGIVTRITCG